MKKLFSEFNILQIPAVNVKEDVRKKKKRLRNKEQIKRIKCRGTKKKRHGETIEESNEERKISLENLWLSGWLVTGWSLVGHWSNKLHYSK